ncbi:MAG: hypothetical protein ACXVBF_10295 [Flavisolibacter sp.]
MRFVFVFICYCFSLASTAQNSKKPCSSPESSQFDFWIGHWDLTWSDSLHGTNNVEKLFGNCTVHENFQDAKNNYLGQSWSVYNANYKYWQQTWVDNQGGYIALTGGMVGDSLILTTAVRTVPLSVSPSGKIVSRMVYYNIKPGSFDWSWESSTDGGKAWKQNWLIHYKRKS